MNQLRREIGRWDLVALVLNLIIGAGIFGLPSRAYALAGVYSLVSYVVCAIMVLLIILCFAEVSSRFKDTGGLYLYAREAFGPLAGFEVGWLAWLVRVTAFAALCNLFADYLSYFVPATASGGARTAAIAAVTAILALANLSGVRFASWVGNVLTVGKLVPLLLLVGVGLFFVDPDRYVFAAPPTYTSFSASVLLLVFAFTGFENALIPAGEARHPQRDLPFALITGTTIAMVWYLAIQAVCIGVLPDLVTSSRPLADAGARLLGGPGAFLISLGAVVSVAGTMNAVMLSAPRLLFAMAQQGQLPQVVASTHRRFHTPHLAILISAAGMLAFTLTETFASAATLSTVIRLITYAVTCAALPVLRRRAGGGRPTFAAPGGEIVAAIALLLIAWLFSSSAWPDARTALVAAGVGLLLYGAYARRRQAPARSLEFP